MSGFEGSYGGDGSRLATNAVLECGVCWWVYDPAVGDDEWQIAAGTAFTALPEHWRCPRCDASRTQFMRIGEQREGDAHTTPSADAAATGNSDEEHAALIAALREAYGRAAAAMEGLPVYNSALEVAVPAVRSFGGDTVAVVVTPWCMNLLVVPENASSVPREGTLRDLAFPSGRYPFIAAWLEGVGALESCSLFSPMESFDDQDAALAVATHALAALFEAPDAEADSAASPESDDPPPASRAVSRRQLLGARV